MKNSGTDSSLLVLFFLRHLYLYYNWPLTTQSIYILCHVNNPLYPEANIRIFAALFQPATSATAAITYEFQKHSEYYILTKMTWSHTIKAPWRLFVDRIF